MRTKETGKEVRKEWGLRSLCRPLVFSYTAVCTQVHCDVETGKGQSAATKLQACYCLKRQRVGAPIVPLTGNKATHKQVKSKAKRNVCGQSHYAGKEEGGRETQCRVRGNKDELTKAELCLWSLFGGIIDLSEREE